ncbi:hypothetical protein RFI_35516, partial [Reticulomyxa filosa]
FFDDPQQAQHVFEITYQIITFNTIFFVYLKNISKYICDIFNSEMNFFRNGWRGCSLINKIVNYLHQKMMSPVKYFVEHFHQRFICRIVKRNKEIYFCHKFQQSLKPYIDKNKMQRRGKPKINIFPKFFCFKISKNLQVLQNLFHFFYNFCQLKTFLSFYITVFCLLIFLFFLCKFGFFFLNFLVEIYKDEIKIGNDIKKQTITHKLYLWQRIKETWLFDILVFEKNSCTTSSLFQLAERLFLEGYLMIRYPGKKKTTQSHPFALGWREPDYSLILHSQITNFGHNHIHQKCKQKQANVPEPNKVMSQYKEKRKNYNFLAAITLPPIDAKQSFKMFGILCGFYSQQIYNQIELQLISFLFWFSNCSDFIAYDINQQSNANAKLNHLSLDFEVLKSQGNIEIQFTSFNKKNHVNVVVAISAYLIEKFQHSFLLILFCFDCSFWVFRLLSCRYLTILNKKQKRKRSTKIIKKNSHNRQQHVKKLNFKFRLNFKISKKTN